MIFTPFYIFVYLQNPGPEIRGTLFGVAVVGGAAVCLSAAPAAGDHVVQRLVESLLV